MSNYKLKIIYKNHPNQDFPNLDIDTFQVKYDICFDLSVLLDAQHDGRLWSKSDIDFANSVLVDEIMSELKRVVSTFVEQANPYSIHNC